MLPCQRKITEVQAHEIELAEDSGLRQRAAFALFSKQAGRRSNLGFTRVDIKNYLRTRRQKKLERRGSKLFVEIFSRPIA